MLNTAFYKHKSIFIPFVMAGHPSPDVSMSAIMALSEVSSDIIEL